jgi:hypothetical protein
LQVEEVLLVFFTVGCFLFGAVGDLFLLIRANLLDSHSLRLKNFLEEGVLHHARVCVRNFAQVFLFVKHLNQTLVQFYFVVGSSRGLDVSLGAVLEGPYLLLPNQFGYVSQLALGLFDQGNAFNDFDFALHSGVDGALVGEDSRLIKRYAEDVEL